MKFDYIKEIDESNVYDVAHKTPITNLNKMSFRFNNNLMIKREDLQPIFSFKCRGSYNKISRLSQNILQKGVIAASAGNHAQGVALSAQFLKIKAIIVMPITTPPIKIESVKRLNGEVLLYGDNFDEAYSHAQELSKEKDMTFIHPFDDPHVIAGQGTVAKEIIEQYGKNIDYIFIPVGGGGLIAGMSLYLKHFIPNCKIISVESEDAPTLHNSFRKGVRVQLDQVGLFVDGCAVKLIGENTFEIAKQYVDDTILVSIDETCGAIKDIFEDTRIMSEPAGALSLAGAKKYILEHKISNKNVIVINSGANLNFDRLKHVAERTEIGDGREILLSVQIPEQPGSLKKFCEIIGKRSISEFNYRLSDKNDAKIFVGIKSENIGEDKQNLLKKLDSNGYQFQDLTHDELSKLHLRYMVGGKPPSKISEKIFRFEFPEKPRALLDFLSSMNEDWSITLFHYRNHGNAYGRVLIGISSDNINENEIKSFLSEMNFNYTDESNNLGYQSFLK